jgi:hypothetical protein
VQRPISPAYQTVQSGLDRLRRIKETGPEASNHTAELGGLDPNVAEELFSEEAERRQLAMYRESRRRQAEEERGLGDAVEDSGGSANELDFPLEAVKKKYRPGREQQPLQLRSLSDEDEEDEEEDYDGEDTKDEDYEDYDGDEDEDGEDEDDEGGEEDEEFFMNSLRARQSGRGEGRGKGREGDELYGETSQDLLQDILPGASSASASDTRPGSPQQQRPRRNPSGRRRRPGERPARRS